MGHVVSELEGAVVDISWVDVGDGLEEGGVAPVDVQVIVEPGRQNGVVRWRIDKPRERQGGGSIELVPLEAYMKQIASLNDFCRNEADKRVLANVSTSTSRIVPLAAKWRRKRASMMNGHSQLLVL